MEAKDTVMNDKELNAWHLSRLESRQGIAQAQAEISFKAGIREVVEWAKGNLLYTHPDSDIKYIQVGRDIEMAWQAKLKEWGIE